MSNESLTPWVAQYRASVGDTLTPTLDQEILAAAARHSARRRMVRNISGAFLSSAIVVFAVSMIWQVRQPGYEPPPVVTEYGRFEGISRGYLLDVRTHQFTGFGIAEGLP